MFEDFRAFTYSNFAGKMTKINVHWWFWNADKTVMSIHNKFPSPVLNFSPLRKD